MRLCPLRFLASLVLGIIGLASAATAQTQEATLVGSGGLDRPVAMSDDGTVALVGVPQRGVDGNDQQGAVYVSVRDEAGNWTFETRLTASDGEREDWFGRSVALNEDGTVALIGASRDDLVPEGEVGPNDHGSAYLFFRDEGGNWTEQLKLTASDGGTGDRFGYSVSLSDDGRAILVGAVSQSIEETDHFNRGGAYLYRAPDPSGPWTLHTTFAPSDPASNQAFGASVSISGDGSTALIGATGESVDGVNNRGRAYVFTADKAWGRAHSFMPSHNRDFLFGISTALSDDGSVALVGTRNGNPGHPARLYAYARDGSGAMAEEARLIASDQEDDDGFGRFVTLDGDGSTALIGAPGDQVDGVSAQGSAYVFDRDGPGTWTEQVKLTASDGERQDQFGTGVVLSDDASRGLIGALGNTGAYVFALTGSAAAPTATTEPATNVTVTSAQLNGLVDPSGAETTVSFVYWPTGQPGQGQTVTAEQSPLTGDSEQAVSATAEFLQGNTEYTYIVSAESSEGLANGSERTFTTGGAAAPTAVTEPATDGTATSAQLHGRVNPNGAETTVAFWYYPVGHAAEAQGVTADQSPLTGTTEQDVSLTLEGLQPNTEYLYFVSAENSVDLTNGTGLTFTTGEADTVTIEVAESIGVSDEVAVTPPVSISVTESIGVSDDVSVAPSVEITVTESIGVSDDVAVNPPVQISITESIGVSDQIGLTPAASITITESIGVSDEVRLMASVLGDVTGDGDVMPFDASQILKHAVGLLQLEGLKLQAADVSGQAGVTSLDASLVLQFYVGQIRCFPTALGCEAAGKRADAFVAGELAWGTPRFIGGEAVELPLVLEGAEGVTALDVTIDVDPAAFEVLSVASGLEGDGTVVHRADSDELRLAVAAAGPIDGEVAVVRLRRKQDDRQVAMEGTWTPNEGTEQTLAAAPVPEDYALAENHPNPFNPETTIGYELPEAADVRLTVLDELGQEVAVLVDERRRAGRYKVTFDAGELASGVYFYRIEAGDFRATRTMVLVK